MNVCWLYQSVFVVFFLTSVTCNCNVPRSADGCTHPMIVPEEKRASFEKCCSIPQVPFNSVEIDYFVTQTSKSEERWRLNTTLRWQAPTNDDGYTYSIEFLPTITLEDLQFTRKDAILNNNHCPEIYRMSPDCPTSYYFSTLVEEETANFTSILFGFEYTFKIQVIHNGTIAPVYTCYFPCSLKPSLNLQAPGIPVSTVPRDVEVEWTIESASVIIHINWTMPLVVNGEIAVYRIEAIRVVPEAHDLPVFFTVKNDTAIQITPDNPRILRGGFMMGYFYEILITPMVNLPAEYRLERTVRGNAATERIYIPADDVTTSVSTSEMSQTVTKLAPGDRSALTLVLVVSSSIFAVLFAVAFVIIIVTCRRIHKPIVQDYGITLQTQVSHLEVVKEEEALPEFRNKEVYFIDDIEIDEEPIGGGEYGMVYIGYLRLEKGTDDPIKVAVKTTKDDLSAVMRNEFLDEIRLMMEIGEHPNIMPVIACKTIAEPYYLITEYMDYGSLKDYLRKCNKPEYVQLDSNYTLTELGQLNIAYQIANGMEYLSSTRFFHGDLAARNILINKKMEVKISDFGLSNDIYARGYVRLPPENKRPVKWYSPEANIHGRCSTEGDVWSYGIVLYEVYVFGLEPYEGMAPREVIVRVNSGYRLEKPDDCPDKVYEIMRKCWQFEPSQRPTFESIKSSLEKLLEGGDSSVEEEQEEEESSDQQVLPLEHRASNSSILSYISVTGVEETTSSSIYD